MIQDLYNFNLSDGTYINAFRDEIFVHLQIGWVTLSIPTEVYEELIDKLYGQLIVKKMPAVHHVLGYNTTWEELAENPPGEAVLTGLNCPICKGIVTIEDDDQKHFYHKEDCVLAQCLVNAIGIEGSTATCCDECLESHIQELCDYEKGT